MPKPVSAIESLPTDAQEQIIAWLEVESRTKVVERLALPPPEGFDLRTHVTTLSRFYARYMARHHQDDLALAKILAPDASANPVETATNSLAAGWALQLGTKPRRNLSAFKAVSRWVLKQRELDHKKSALRLLAERFNFDREKWEYDISRQVLMHRNALDQIATDTVTTDEEKINRARALFSTAPSTNSPANP